MAVSPCLPSVTSSTLMERFAQVESKGSAIQSENLTTLQLPERLAGFLNKNANGADTGNHSTDDTEQTRMSTKSSVPTPTSAPQNSPIPSNTELSLLQAQQLALLLSSLACRTSPPSTCSTIVNPTNSVNGASPTQTGQPDSSPNILQQLLCGADVNQLRNRSGLIESNLSETEGIKNGTSPQNGSQIHSVEKSEELLCPNNANEQVLRGLINPTTQWINPILRLPMPVLNTGVTAVPVSQLSSVLLPPCGTAEQLLAILSELTRATQPRDNTPPLQTKNLPSSGVQLFVNFPLNRVTDTSTAQSASNGMSTTTPSPTATSSFCFSRLNSDIPNDSVSNLNAATMKPGISPTLNPAFQDLETNRTRPRSYSDLHSGMNARQKCHGAHRPRSHSKIERSMKPSNSSDLPDKLSKELQSSLFAQLVLNPDTPSPKDPTDSPTDTKFEVPRTMKVECRPSSNSSVGSCSNRETSLYCSFQVRDQIFEWLREADLFVAEHCCDIPLGALLAAAITPSRSGLAELCATFVTSSCSEPVSATAKRAVSKCWYQFLLVSLMENEFIPSVSTGVSPPHADHITQSNNHTERPSNPLQDKLKKAIATLAALETEDSPPPDRFLLSELTSLIKTASELTLSADVYKSMRFCILAQCAYPLHFSTSFTEALSALQNQFGGTQSDQSKFTEVLKLLNRLHCFDPATLKQFFCLATDNLTEATPDLISTSKSTTNNGESTGSCKRKASQSSLTRLVLEREASPVALRPRTYTTTSCNKSARMSRPSINP